MIMIFVVIVLIATAFGATLAGVYLNYQRQWQTAMHCWTAVAVMLWISFTLLFFAGAISLPPRKLMPSSSASTLAERADAPSAPQLTGYGMTQVPYPVSYFRRPTGYLFFEHS